MCVIGDYFILFIKQSTVIPVVDEDATFLIEKNVHTCTRTVTTFPCVGGGSVGGGSMGGGSVAVTLTGERPTLHSCTQIYSGFFSMYLFTCNHVLRQNRGVKGGFIIAPGRFVFLFRPPFFNLRAHPFFEMPLFSGILLE
jgi:hypothetical protein